MINLTIFQIACILFYCFIFCMAYLAWRKGACSSSLSGYVAGGLIVGVLTNVIGSAYIVSNIPDVETKYDCSQSNSKEIDEFMKHCMANFSTSTPRCTDAVLKLHCKPIPTDTVIFIDTLIKF